MPVVKMTLWQNITENRKEDEKYDIVNYGSIKLDGYPGIRAIHLDKGWLSDVFSKNMLSRNLSNNAIFIVAQTGSGKTTFVFKKCIPVALQEKKKVLYLCSRKALCSQIKRIAMKDEVNGELFVGNMQVKNLKNYYTEVGLESTTNFGAIDVMTYHTFVRSFNSINPNDYSFIIADECHFFLSDATFNALTYDILQKLVRKFQSSRRIYLTATPQECLGFIWNEESYKNFKGPISIWSTMDVYIMQENYAYINPSFFTNIDEIVEVIKESITEPWLIFVKDKRIGEKLVELLTHNDIVPEFVTAESDKDTDVYKKLINDETMSCKILISTKVLDVGVNVKTKGLNVVVFDDDPVEIKQMLGRKRVLNNERINVFFYIPSQSELSARSRGIIKKIADIEQIALEVKNNRYLEIIAAPFYLKGSKLECNPFCIAKLKNEVQHCETLISLYKDANNKRKEKQIYAKHLLAEFNDVAYDEDTLFIGKKAKKLERLLCNYLNKSMNKSDYDSLARQIIEITGDNRENPRENTPSTSTINECLKGFDFYVEAVGTPRQYFVKRGEITDV